MESTVDRARLHDLMKREEERFVESHPRSAELFEQGKRNLLAGVPMPWMSEWAGPFPVFVREAHGARFVDVDGMEYVDLCPGDRGGMTGHSPEPAVKAIAEQAARGITLMLPSEDSIWVGAEMQRRFGLPYWQFCLTATDANRFTIRLARAITGRPKVLTYSWCYHGSVDETIAIEVDGPTVPRPGNIGPPVPPEMTTRSVEWNDVEALEAALANGDVACVLAEPALTNIGIVLPEPGYHDALRELTRRYGTYLVIDETHTICAGPGGGEEGRGPGAGLPHDRQAARERRAGRVLRHERGGRAADPWLHGVTALDRRRRRRRDALGQRALARGDARDARAGPHR